jgi:hypothetical protein
MPALSHGDGQVLDMRRVEWTDIEQTQAVHRERLALRLGSACV